MKILLMTGYSQSELQILTRTCLPVLRKPFLPADLIRSVNSLFPCQQSPWEAAKGSRPALISTALEAFEDTSNSLCKRGAAASICLIGLEIHPFASGHGRSAVGFGTFPLVSANWPIELGHAQ